MFVLRFVMCYYATNYLLTRHSKRTLLFFASLIIMLEAVNRKRNHKMVHLSFADFFWTKKQKKGEIKFLKGGYYWENI